MQACLLALPGSEQLYVTDFPLASFAVTIRPFGAIAVVFVVVLEVVAGLAAIGLDVIGRLVVVAVVLDDFMTVVFALAAGVAFDVCASAVVSAAVPASRVAPTIRAKGMDVRMASVLSSVRTARQARVGTLLCRARGVAFVALA